MKTAVVTGAAGFIGGAFTAYLLEKGYRVFAVSREPSRIKGVLENEQFRPVKADFSEYGLLSNQISKADIFYHFAWDGVGGENAVNCEIQLENIKATCEAIQQAAKIGCKKFVYAGSVSELEIRECLDKNVCAPRLHCVYASAKLTAETLCKILAAQYGILFNAGLFANIIGPGDYSRRSTNSILNQFLHGEAPKLVKGDGLNDWLYIKDAVRLIEAMGEYGKHNKTYYIGHTELWPLRKTIEKARDIVAPGLQLKFGVIPDTFLIDYSYVDPKALFLDTGCKASYSFTQAIRETADWVRTLSF